ncbi:binding protein, partial [Reticulomyxa filosa]
VFVEKKIDNILWKVVYLELQPLMQQQMTSKREVSERKHKLYEKLFESIRFYNDFVNSIEEIITEKMKTINAAKESVQNSSNTAADPLLLSSSISSQPSNLSMSTKRKAAFKQLEKEIDTYHLIEAFQLARLGDLQRYVEKFTKQESEQSWNVAVDCYTKGLQCYPGIGQIYNNLGVIAYTLGDDFVSMHQYMRALSTPQHKFCAHENLLAAIERNRNAFEKLLKEFDIQYFVCFM